MFRLHHIQGHIQTIYLAEHPQGLVLLDGCCRADVATVCRFIREELKLSLGELKLVVVTHMHPDHAGGAHALKRKTGARIVAADVAGDWYRGLDGIAMHLTDMALAAWVAKRMAKPMRWLWYSRRLRADVLLGDDTRLPGFPEWRVFHCPGHTDRDLALLHEDSSCMYVADLLVRVKGRYIPPFPLFYPNRYKSSLMKLRVLAPKQVLLAHGGVVTLEEIELERVLEEAPTVPMTHWRSVKAKLKQIIG
ncbi:MBL fold metallo-hydrolase [Shewanella sp. JM162201]|uniref:MBL fold metallo-hydrolase n=1 Tax=Shewanella jiangmenensis TaxID=2837387 RepID=A0ABS5V0G9_9GAMM|nr:MBL fold metallo-hydrolase [Shewanella jiangmenensis]MBT1443925.1 MBL fold metallo-hydrolase [Shewanella jiangmenensis]